MSPTALGWFGMKKHLLWYQFGTFLSNIGDWTITANLSWPLSIFSLHILQAARPDLAYSARKGRSTILAAISLDKINHRLGVPDCSISQKHDVSLFHVIVPWLSVDMVERLIDLCSAIVGSHLLNFGDST